MNRSLEFSQTHKIGNICINGNFVFPYVWHMEKERDSLFLI